MIRLVATLHLVALTLVGFVARQGEVLRRSREERGSVTIEQVMWAAAIIVIVGVVVVAIRGFVDGQIEKIRD